MVLDSVCSVRWLHLSIVKSDEQSGKQASFWISTAVLHTGQTGMQHWHHKLKHIFFKYHYKGEK